MNANRLRIRWQEIFTRGYPPRDPDPDFNRYSVPVLAGNSFTGAVDVVAYRWDYKKDGWVYSTLDDGDGPEHYEVQFVDYWALWPVFNPNREDLILQNNKPKKRNTAKTAIFTGMPAV